LSNFALASVFGGSGSGGSDKPCIAQMEANETMKANRRGFLQDAGGAWASFDLGDLPFATRSTPRAARLK
jgi:hypothetical protein